jgi:hypothetical protein
MLCLEAVSFLLPYVSSLQQTAASPTLTCFIDGHEMYGVIDRVLLELASVDC